MPRRPRPERAITVHVIVLLLAAAAVVADDPARWATGRGLLRHAAWEGAGPADFVAPVFLFFLGAAVPLSRRTGRTGPLLIAMVVCAAGLAVNAILGSDPEAWRVTGVLQRAGVTLAAATVATSLATGEPRRQVAILTSIGALITLAYWLVMAHVPPPGGVPGDLSPGGNLAAWGDRAVLGRHAWSASWDPDGVLSTVSSISTVLFGMSAAISASSKSGGRGILQLVGSGAAAIVCGVLSTVAIPINRTLWSGSFVLVSTGVASILLAPVLWIQQRR
jgi:predicted acyltransferase